ncbi:uncharacterized protein EV422DRAFT_210657 [Fimicolochytrium jonesii]|uniref:uncharacterized protein n=1 Tax=Fimicolochytrium jonesii TaxID=1396493 RepID=UPI0022FDEA37|nr:uncharacterized protein EV422DRAFT_210657 [Fimicolochytrium jonesii]KAI8817654.1 hypothetical protein EV422DRAFT_210657 [Fimicolochytrium jonesii]
MFAQQKATLVFSSSLQGLLLANSDIDVVVFTPAPAPPETTTPTRTTVFDETFEDPEREHNLRILRTLRETLHKSGLPLQSSIRLVGEANVPVLKFVEKITRIPVDVSVNNSHGMISTEIIQNWIREYPPLRPVTLLIKHYVWRAGMNDTYTGGFGSYVIVNMVVFMFKQFPTLLEGPDIYAKTFICFLRYYGTLFNYRQYGISTIDNVAFKLSQDHRVWQNPARAESVPFVVEDPTNRKRNVGKSASNAGTAIPFSL